MWEEILGKDYKFLIKSILILNIEKAKKIFFK